MPSIVNGLFAGRSGITSHGTAIAVVGDNISNASTIGYKSARAEFEDLVAGGQTAGKVVGSGSSISSVSTTFEQGTLEFTSKTLDLAIDGNGFFVLDDNGQRFYTRAGNFKIDSSGYVTNQNGLRVLGFPSSNGTGDLEALNITNLSQDTVDTNRVTVSGNVDARAAVVGAIPVTKTEDTAGAEPGTDYSDLNTAAEFSTVVNVFDSLGDQHTITFFFFKTAANTYTVNGYANSEEVDSAPGAVVAGTPRLIGSQVMTFAGDGSRNDADANALTDFTSNISWINGASASTIDIKFGPFTQYASSSNVLSITQDGQGIGTVTKLSIEKDGTIFALLSNGQSATMGTIGLANFSNPEGLTRIGGTLLQQSASSGEPVNGTPQAGTFGDVLSGSIELSTVDIANEFVKMITLQRGFQASSRIITTINQLLSEIIQLA